MKKIIITLVLFVLVLGGVFVGINSFMMDDYDIYEENIVEKFTEVYFGDEIKRNGKTFVIEKLEKVSDTRCNLVLSKGSYKDFINVLQAISGKNNSIHKGGDAVSKVEKNEKGEIVGIYFSENTEDKANLVKLQDIEQIILLNTDMGGIKENFVINLK